MKKKSRLRKEGFLRGLIKLSHNKLSVIGIIYILIAIFCAVFAPWIAPYPEDAYDEVHFDRKFKPPCTDYLMGTDEAGRDVLTRVLYGARISLLLAVVALSIAITIGVPLGMFAAYYRGWIEQLIMRITDVFLSIPVIVAALAISVALSPSLINSMLALGFVWWRSWCRVSYGETLSINQENYVVASRALGVSDAHILFREILPNMSSTLLVKMTIDAGYCILTGTAISFLGAGANPPTPEWGLMVAYSRHYLPDIWWSSLFPGLAIFATVLSFNLLGDGLRDFFGVEVD